MRPLFAGILTILAAFPAFGQTYTIQTIAGGRYQSTFPERRPNLAS